MIWMYSVRSTAALPHDVDVLYWQYSSCLAAARRWLADSPQLVVELSPGYKLGLGWKC